MFNSFSFNSTPFNSVKRFIEAIVPSLIVSGAIPLTSNSHRQTIQTAPDVIGLSSLSETVILR